jgi:hypothetical protein
MDEISKQAKPAKTGSGQDFLITAITSEFALQDQCERARKPSKKRAGSEADFTSNPGPSELEAHISKTPRTRFFVYFVCFVVSNPFP